MKIKPDNIEFISFSDGVCNIYSEDDEGNKTYKYKGLGFSNRVLGFKRFYAAAASQTDINKVIRIPQLKGITTYDHVEINGDIFDIKMVQAIYDTNPPCIDLTLQ